MDDKLARAGEWEVDALPKGGCKLVPVVLTELHLMAGHEAMVRFKPDTVRGKPVFDALREVWFAMLAAAPSPTADSSFGETK